MTLIKQIKQKHILLTITKWLMLGSLVCLTACDPIADSSDRQEQNTEQNTTTQEQIEHSSRHLQRTIKFANNVDFTQNTPHFLAIDSFTARDNVTLLYDLYEGLTGYDRAGNVIPAVAESWQSTDNKTWVFHLRQNAYWSNGQPVTATDFVNSWQNVLLLAHFTQQTPSDIYLLQLGIKNAYQVATGQLDKEQLAVRAIDQYTLQIELERENAILPIMLAHYSLFPFYTAKSEHLVSNGAYQLKEANTQRISLMANPYYWNNKQLSFDRVDYLNRADENISTKEQIDWLVEPANESVNTKFVPQLCTYFYEFNLTQFPFNNKFVRQAIRSLASPKSVMTESQVKMLANSSVLPYSFVKQENNYSSVIIAENLLQQANIDKQIDLDILYDNAPLHRIIATTLARLLSQSDLIKVKLKAVSREQLLQRRYTGDFQLSRAGWCADYADPLAFLQPFHSASPDNKSGYHNAQVDQLLEQAIQQPDSEKRTALYQQIAALINDDAVIIPFFQYQTAIEIDPSVQGYQLTNPTGIFYSKDLYRVNK